MKDNESVLSKYELVVGLEIHVQLSTNTKIFSYDSAAYGADPNENTSIISLGLPGTLPKLNKKVVEYAVKMGLATNCSITRNNRFDRKNYFYADLPKGYQVTQDEAPICKEGYILINIKGQEPVKVRINRIHMEEDAGKSMHDKDDHYSLIDLNRAGVPLIEIVSEPDIRTPEQAAAYFSEIRKIAMYLDICDGNMEEGSMRCDANISVRLKGDEKFGNRCEVKNLNSVRNLQRAISYEFKRQVGLLEDGEYIGQNTLNFDAGTGTTSVLRSKEMAYDYRYFPEPDLQPLELSAEWIEGIRKALPELPEARSQRYQTANNLSAYDSGILSNDKQVADFFDEVILHTKNQKAAANWILGPILSYVNEHSSESFAVPVKADKIAEMISLVDDGKINNSAATQQLFPALIQNPDASVQQLAEKMNLLIDTNTDELVKFIDEAIALYPDKVAEFNKGKKGVLGLFMGEVMKLSKGKIDPKQANKLVIEKLESFK
ncbi:Asp-tRNA(Asn)/Glu-tRNA(Gln) amidotransferase subunit GatB [Pedobacter sp. HMF7647]|uniref:Aspartyl/glutamyl-tRNA(Asn/Gln) amidotransferase subunit B n=1 Tax=Hufsiella arboris TaxID=2695275 RepID=A0A7K1Y845_9SPHI|nr:Asp-tRNA(Asn)/Glu-tRNA(Gln) amidotransferase subunit GatB [Hufsiella arboris]MXV50541.1 Asp-tRNA(Asn)/Glu-tRNA(Gln) amidotransferase subunit GatB [Hufsiella arboris]